MIACLCYCGLCDRNHGYYLEPSEFRMLISLPGAMRPDGRLSLACDECRPLEHSKPKGGA